MTLTADVAVGKRVEVRALFSYLGEMDDKVGNPYPFMLGDAVEHLQGLENLVYLCSVADWDGASSARDADRINTPGGLIRNLHLRSISYASPLEVVVWFFAGTGAATLATNRLVNVWKNWQSARMLTAEANLYVTAANVLQATIDAPIPIGPDATGYDRFQLATNVLLTLGTLDVNEEM